MKKNIKTKNLIALFKHFDSFKDEKIEDILYYTRNIYIEFKNSFQLKDKDLINCKSKLYVKKINLTFKKHVKKHNKKDYNSLYDSYNLLYMLYAFSIVNNFKMLYNLIVQVMNRIMNKLEK